MMKGQMASYFFMSSTTLGLLIFNLFNGMKEDKGNKT